MRRGTLIAGGAAAAVLAIALGVTLVLRHAPAGERAEGGPAAGGEAGTETAGLAGIGAETVPAETAGEAAEAGGAAAETPAAAPPAEGPSFVGDQNRREVVLFFQEKNSEYLGTEKRKIFLTASPTDQAKQIIVEVINGPQDGGLLPTVPPQTHVRGLYLDRWGTAYLDLSGEVVTAHPGGTAEEIATLFSLVNSLTYNLPEIKRVHLLVDGEERETLLHLDLRRDYRQDLSIVDMEGERAG